MFSKHSSHIFSVLIAVSLVLGTISPSCQFIKGESSAPASVEKHHEHHEHSQKEHKEHQQAKKKCPFCLVFSSLKFLKTSGQNIPSQNSSASVSHKYNAILYHTKKPNKAGHYMRAPPNIILV